ncbi:MAG: VRR-NUC domain-containing protein [Oscillospiraceae bacterium]
MPKHTMTEAQIESRMDRMVRERGGLFYKFTSPNNPGVPDRILITPQGRIVFVELKTERGSLQRIQEWQLDRMREHNTEVRVVKGWEAARALVEEVMPK